MNCWRSNIYVYPNPTINNLYISSDNLDYSFSIYDMQGQRIAGPIIPNSTRFTFSTASLSSGIYLVIIEKGNQIFNLKISENMK
ncbi:MAG: T9SS type A sorting domain-containing protein [Bacteroidetes bacterium]|nr:T9SS type A sorting domain-containing protein [Bacteroidota bacterium]